MTLLSDKSMRNIGGDLGRRRATANGDHKLFVVVQQKKSKNKTHKKKTVVCGRFLLLHKYLLIKIVNN